MPAHCKIETWLEGRSDVAEGAADETEQVVQQEGAQDEKCDDDGDGGRGMSRGEPSQPDGEEIFAET